MQRTYHPAPQGRDDHGVTHGGESVPALIDPLITPTWAEVEEAREQYHGDARRLRYWRWWFVGMFTFYTTLVGILLLKLFVG